ncbi:MAG: hypothetical protein ACRDG3_05865, partial [Tepidiformaceae bacterium]
QFYDPLMPAWSLGHYPARAVIVAANDALAKCLRDNGFTIDAAHPGASDFQRVENTGGRPDPRFLDCSQTVTKQFKLYPGFGGG